MGLPPVVGLEIGTSKTVALVGEMREDGYLMITGAGELPSVGMRKGEIVDMSQAQAGVRSVLEMAEESAKVAIRQVHLAVSGGHIQSLVNRGVAPVFDPDSGIGPDDIQQVMDVARAVNLSADREVLHTICQDFRIDGQERVVNPEGMDGAKLEMNMLVLHGVRSRLHNAVRLVQDIPLDVEEVVFGGLCSAMACLTAEQRNSGVVLIDLGGGTTDYFVYAGNVVAAAGSLGVGGDHVTNDIALAFNIPMARAERLKREQGHALSETGSEARRISLPAEVGFASRSISLNALHTVVHARCDELLGMVKARLGQAGVLPRIGAGVVVTGGGAHLAGVDKLVEKTFGLPCYRGFPRHVSGLATATEGPEYAACAGLIQFGFKSMNEQRDWMPWSHWLKNIFRW